MKVIADFLQDVIIAVRTLSRRPAMAVVPVVSSALGISACSLIIGIANVALFRPLPVSDGGRLMSIGTRNLKTGEIGNAASYPDYLDLKRAHSFEGSAAYFPMTPAAISLDGSDARRYWGTIATANYFDVVRPDFILGRGFDPSRDDAPDAPPVIVLSHRLWVSSFGGNPGLLGRTIVLNGRNVTVAGITQGAFRGTDVGIASDFWIPFSMRDLIAPMLPRNKLDLFSDRDAKWLFLASRLAASATQEQAAAEVNVIGRRLSSAYPATNRDRGFYLERAGQLVPPVRRAVFVFFALLLAVCGLILFTACANIANLLLARATARQKEMATRRAIGAGTGRLVRQLLTESILLSLAGGAFGYAIAALGAGYFGRWRLPMALPVDLSVPLDYRVLAACTAVSVFTGIAFGLAPALHAIRQNLVTGLKDAPLRPCRSAWWSARNFLMAGQIAVCIVLLVCSGLFFRTLSSARAADTGMAYRNLLLIGFDPYAQSGAGGPDTLFNRLLGHVRAVPGVASAALTSNVPLSLAGVSGRIQPEDRAGHSDGALEADIYDISSRFFITLGIRFLAGEDFRPGDEDTDTAILNEAAAARLFPAENPIGRRVQTDNGRVLRVVGVVANVKSRMMVEAPRICMYRPLSGSASLHSITGVTLLVRTEGDPAGFMSELRSVIQQVDRGLPLFDIRTMSEQISQALLLQRAGAILFGLAGIIGLLIAATGLYGLISFLVARQTKEIGIRMALGARRGQILGAVLGRGLRLTMTGSAIGLAIAALLSQGIASLLYGVRPTDGLTFAAATGFVLLVALAASLVPALRAANVQPILSIRNE